MQLDQEFSRKVLNKIAYIDRIVDGWLDAERMEFVHFLGNLYKPDFVYEVGLVTMKKVLRDSLLIEGEKNPNLLAIVMYLLSGNKEEIEVMKYQTVNLDIISLTDVSLLLNADLNQEFIDRMRIILEEKFLNSDSN
jgi:hypothetical protein